MRSCDVGFSRLLLCCVWLGFARGRCSMLCPVSCSWHKDLLALLFFFFLVVLFLNPFWFVCPCFGVYFYFALHFGLGWRAWSSFLLLWIVHAHHVFVFLLFAVFLLIFGGFPSTLLSFFCFVFFMHEGEAVARCYKMSCWI